MARYTEPKECVDCACNIRKYSGNGCWRYVSKRHPIRDENGFCEGKMTDKEQFEKLKEKVEGW